MSGSRNPFVEASHVRERNEYQARKPAMQGSEPKRRDIAKLIVDARDVLDPHLVTDLSKAGNVESLHDLMSTRAEAKRLCAVLAHAPVAKDDKTVTIMTWQDASVEFASLLDSSHNHIAAEMLRSCVRDFSDAAFHAIAHSSNLDSPLVLDIVACESGRRRRITTD